MTRSMEALLGEAEQWVKDDPDPVTRAELEQLIVTGDEAGLLQRFGAPLVFGTAGLRGFIGAGPAWMNDVTVGRATAGLAQQLISDLPGAQDMGIVIGRDGRHKSVEFARLAAEILAGYGFRVYAFEPPVPTPLAAFAGRYLGCASTIVVTASHNPPQYNGFKVYAPQGYQIVAPQDARILAASGVIERFADIPRMGFETAQAEGRVSWIGDDVIEAYYQALDEQCMTPVSKQALSIVTTSLHGVGHPWLMKALERRGFECVWPVEAQAQPDPDFPTVALPNPEEDGALDLAMALAREKQADVILANDPDADRLCVAVRKDGDYQLLTGNELGILLADWLLGQAQERGVLPQRSAVITTVVSTSLLQKLAQSYGVESYAVLTGFKWIWDKAVALEADGVSFRFGFEEALGYCVGAAVRDKDGIGAAQVLAELAASLKTRGLTLCDALDGIRQKHGFYASEQVATVFDGLDGKKRIEAVMSSLRQTMPTEITGQAVTLTEDLAQGGTGLPRSNVIITWLNDDSRIIFRPSGTEPKLKAYLEVCVPVIDGDLSQARQGTHSVR
jgi:phosphomannomutase